MVTSGGTRDLCMLTRSCALYLPPMLYDAVVSADIKAAKGPVFTTAIIAGTQAVKRTSELIPFCHPLIIDGCKIDIHLDPRPHERHGQHMYGVVIACTVRCHGRTGVEMEALTGCMTAALTVYDMCKAVSTDMVITECQLVKKSGGKTDIDRTERMQSKHRSHDDTKEH